MFKKVPNAVDTNLRLSLVNARSVRNKTTTLNDFICENDIDILAITETWLSADNDGAVISSLLPNGYAIHQNPRLSRGGGGLALIFKSSIKVERQKQFNYTSFEYLDCIVKLSKEFRIILVYRPPNNSLQSQFIDEFSDLGNNLASSRLEPIFLGDFNCHIDIKDNIFSARFCDLLKAHTLIQHVDLATHNRGHTLDLVITREGGLSVNNVDVTDKLISDHFPVNFSLKIEKTTISHKADIIS